MRRYTSLAALALLFSIVVLVVAGRSSACDDGREAAREAGRAAQRAAERAQRTAERVARQGAERARIAAEQAQYAAERAAERAQIQADEASERAAAEAERVARAAQRTAERAARRAAARAAYGSGGVVATDGGLLFVDGPEVPWTWVESADDARSRRIVRPTVTDTTLRVSPGMTLALANLSGDIVVRVWDRSEVRIHAEHDRSDRLVANLKDGMLRLGVSPLEAEPADVEWSLTVPTWLPLEISGTESAIAVTGVGAGVRAQSMRGDVRVNACQGPIELISVEGDVHVQDVSGNVTASSVNSDVRLVRVSGPVEAQSVNGDIQMEDVSSVNVSASTLNGQVYFSSQYQPHGRYAFSTHNGKLHVGVGNDEPVNFTLSSFNGQVQSTVPVPPSPSPMPYRRALRFSIPAEPSAPPQPPSPRAAPQARAPRAPRAPEVELESFDGLIQLASREAVEQALELRRSLLDSLRAQRDDARSYRYRYTKALTKYREKQAKAPKGEETPEPPKR